MPLANVLAVTPVVTKNGSLGPHEYGRFGVLCQYFRCVQSGEVVQDELTFRIGIVPQGVMLLETPPSQFLI